ncbi:MAG: DinB family protein [Acidobacteria bacterium]|nr:DinB family protein [Acidobacteriota bacterium]
MTSEERGRLIESYENAPAALEQAINGLPDAEWDFKPAPDRWSIREIVFHLTDADVNGYVRCRAAIAEPGKTIMAYDQDRWTQSLNHEGRSVKDALELFRLIRRTTARLLRSLPEESWSRTIHHPESGVMTLGKWLEIYERHPRSHIDQMRKLHDQYRLSRGA